MTNEEPTVVDKALGGEYLSEDEIKVILDIFGKLDLKLEDSEIIIPIKRKLVVALAEPKLEPDKKIRLGHVKVELTKP